MERIYIEKKKLAAVWENRKVVKTVRKQCKTRQNSYRMWKGNVSNVREFNKTRVELARKEIDSLKEESVLLEHSEMKLIDEMH